MKRLAVIPARGGSKRIPRKNIKLFCGKPIIAYSIEAALRSGLFEHVIVSTDDTEIAATAMECGAEVPFLRPAHLADDFAGTQAVVRHALEFFTSRQIVFDQVCCVYATAPLLVPETIITGCEILTQNDCAYVVTVAEFRFPAQRALINTEKGNLQALYPEQMIKRSQDLPRTYHDAGQIYWGSWAAFAEDRKIWGDATFAQILPAMQVQDIDTEEDWQLAELKYRLLQGQKNDAVRTD